MKIFRNEPCTGSLDFVRTGLEWLAPQGLKNHRRVLGFHRDRLERRLSFLDNFGYAGDGAARADRSNKDIDLSTRIRPDLFRRRFLMNDRVCRVIKLLRHPGVWSRLQDL